VERVQVADALVYAGGRRAGCRLGIAALDRIAQRRRVAVRRDAEIAVERARTLAVLTQRGGALAGSRMQSHERAMRRFVERIEREPPAGIRDCVHRVALLMGEPLERAPELLPERLGLGRLPFVELDTVA